jgi:hypothetical protein
MKKSHLFGIVFTLLALPAEIQAGLVTFNVSEYFTGGNWGDQYSNPGIVLGPLETSANNLDILSFTWTFDTAAPDSNPDPDWGYYDGAIVDCSLTMGMYSFTCGGDPNQIELGFEFSYFELDGTEWGQEKYIANATLADASGFSNISFQFFTEWVSVEKGSLLPNGDALIAQPWAALSTDTFFSINYDYQGTVYSGASSTLGGEVWSVVPVPPALWLFGSGLLGLAGSTRWRKTAEPE